MQKKTMEQRTTCSDKETYCPQCGKYVSTRVMKRRLPTHYIDDAMNYLESCYACWKEAFEYYDAMDKDLHSGGLN